MYRDNYKRFKVYTLNAAGMLSFQIILDNNYPLLDAVHSRSGNISFRPKKGFCYQPLKESITRLFQQKDFIKLIQLWRERNVPDEVMGDVYDGEVWHTFRDNDGNRFIDQPHNLMLFLQC